MDSLDENKNHVEPQETQEKIILEKPKKPRTPAQVQATLKMHEARKLKQSHQLEEKQKLKDEEQKLTDKLKEKIEEKIVKKAINIKRKKDISKKQVNELLNETDEDEAEVKETPKPKKEIPSRVPLRRNAVILPSQDAKPKLNQQFRFF